MGDWAEKRAEQNARFDAAVDALRAAKEAFRLAEHESIMLQIQVRAEVYGDGSQWNGVDDPRITARVIEDPDVAALLEFGNAAGIRMGHADAELAKAQPKHFYGD